jgi:hypothetical protein
LTAAHCYLPSNLVQYVSVNAWQRSTEVGVEVGNAEHIQVADIQIHPDFGKFLALDNDYILLKLARVGTEVTTLLKLYQGMAGKEPTKYTAIGMGRSSTTYQSTIIGF